MQLPALPDDDDKKWVYRLHTAVKHQILQKYLGAWVPILGKWNKRLVYVDGFAGRGRYSKGEAGSPLRVIDTLVERMDTFPGSPEYVTCHFIEAHAGNRDNLSAELTQHPNAHDRRIGYRVHPHTFEADASGIMREIRATGEPAFFFVDPFGYDDMPMSLLEEILQLPRTEMLINLMTSFIHRGLAWNTDPKMAHTLTTLFGSQSWQMLAVQQDLPMHQAIVQLYCDGLKKLGAEYTVPFPMGHETIRKIIYYLIHVTNSDMGARIMKDQMIKAGTSGQFGFSLDQPLGHVAMIHHDLDMLPELLIQNFKGRTLRFEQVIAGTLDTSGAYMQADYRRVVKDLATAGKVKIHRVKNPAGKGLDYKDLVEFLH